MDSLIKAAMVDTEPCVILTSIRILTILLPIVAKKATTKLDELLYVLKRMIKWEMQYRLLLPASDPKALVPEILHSTDFQELDSRGILICL